MPLRTITRRDRGSIETNFARLAPVELNGVPAGAEATAPLTARTLLGSFTMSRKLGLIDLKVLAFVIERWREAGHRTASDSVSFTLYRLGQAIYGRTPDGEERRLLRASIERLFQVQVEAYGEDARVDGRPVRKIAMDGRLFTQKNTVWDDADERGPTPTEVAQRRGDSYRVWLGPWLVEQLRSGNVTYLHFPTMRGLAGLSLRLWVLLQAEPFIVDTDGEHEEIAAPPALSDELFATLGMNFARTTDARKALRFAAQRIQNVDGRYDTIEPIKGDDRVWRLHASRAARPVDRPGPHIQEVLPI